MAAGEARVPVLAEIHTKQHKTTEVSSSGGELSRTASVVTSLVSGAAAGALAKTAIAPLDRTKINFQISNTPYSWRAALEFFTASVRREGWRALWRGNSATMARIVPYAAIQFTAHEQAKKILEVDTPQKAKASPLRHLVAGSVAGVVSQSATYPLDLARARMAVTSATVHRTLASVFTHLLTKEGATAMYRGYLATVLGVIPYAGVSFFTYDTLKQLYFEYMGCVQSGVVSVCLGGAAGALAQTASYPLDIVRRRMQTASGDTHRTIRATAAHVYRTEGVRGFFKGLSMNWVKGPIAVGISFATYDVIKSNLRDLVVRLDR